MLSRRVVTSAPLDKEIELAKSLRKYGGDKRIEERERQIEGYLTQSGLSDDERHDALRNLRATHAMRKLRSVSVYTRDPRIWARIDAYRRMAGDRWEPKNDEQRRQLTQVEHDFELTKDEVKGAATDKAYGVLMASGQIIFDSLAQFGITDPTPVDSAIRAVHLGGKSAESQASLWLDKARQVYGAAYNRRGAVSSRTRFAKQVDELIDLQKTARKAAQDELKARAKARGGGVFAAVSDMAPAKRGKKHRPKDPAHAKAWDALQDARRALDLAWIDTERANPALAAYRERGGELADVDLGKKGMGGDERMRQTLVPIVEKLVNIHEAIAALDQGKLKPLSLGPVVRATRAQLLIPPGSVFDPAVRKAIDEAGETSWAMKIMDAVMFAMSFTGIGSIAAGAYDLLKEYVKYENDKRLSNTALDASKSISDVDPSLTGLILAAVDLGMSVNEIRVVMKEARQLKKAMLEGDDAARRQLDELGERHGLPDLADDVAKREGKTAKPAPAPAKATTEPPKDAKPVGKPTKSKAAGAAQAATAAISDKERRKFRKQVQDAMRAGQPSGTPGSDTEWWKLEQLLKGGSTKSKLDASTEVEIRTMHSMMRNPDVLTRAAEELWAQSRATGKTPDELLIKYYGGPLPRLTTQRTDDFWRAAVDDKPFVDMVFGDSAHGSYTHVFQMYAIDLAYGPGRAARFRKKLSTLEVEVPLPSGETKQLRDLVWDATFDEYNTGNLNAPEILGPILEKHIGMRRRPP
jgi:hypothetical protein